jgi:hypothetical protein
MRIALTLIVLLFSSAAHAAQEKTIWSCRTSQPDAKPLLHLVEWGSKSYVKFAHMRFSALHQSSEDMQGWYWHNDGSGYYQYAIVVDYEGTGWYHDFSKRGQAASTAIDYFQCEKAE